MKQQTCIKIYIKDISVYEMSISLFFFFFHLKGLVHFQMKMSW